MAYATAADIARYGINAAALAGIADATVEAALAAASATADSYLRARYPVPLAAWGEDLRQATAQLAAYDLLAVRGFNPDSGDQVVADRAAAARRWLRDVAHRDAHLVGVADANQTPPEGAPSVVYDTRLWDWEAGGWRWPLS